VVCSNDGDTHNSPCEQLEAKYPILIERQALRPDSGGAGKHRGGLGTETVVRARSTIAVDIQADRMHCAPWGLEGGHAGLANQVFVAAKGEDPAGKEPGKVRNQRLRAGDRLFLRAGGGGGFGPPETRDAERVAHDVRQGYISAASAREKYKVVLQADGSVDRDATARCRTEAC
jgi:N-methylhydantoinase B